MTDNRFTSAMVAMVPDADPGKHRSVIETSCYRLTSILVRDEEKAVAVCKDLVQREGVRSFILCPGFTNSGIGKIAEALGRDVSVCVARGDGPSGAIAHRAMERAGFFQRK